MGAAFGRWLLLVLLLTLCGIVYYDLHTFGGLAVFK